MPVQKQRLEVTLTIEGQKILELTGIKRVYEVGEFPFTILNISGETDLLKPSDYSSYSSLYERLMQIGQERNPKNYKVNTEIKPEQ